MYCNIRAYLQCGVICDKYLPLDGILLYQQTLLDNGYPDNSIPGAYNASTKTRMLPIKVKHSGQSDWYYHCSWAQWSHNVEAQDKWCKRFDTRYSDAIDFGKRKGGVEVKKGHYRAYNMPVFYRVSEYVEWYCDGDIDAIEVLLSQITYIGKKRSQGWGRVAKWEVSEIDNDWSLIKDGNVTRGLPFSDIPPSVTFQPGHYGIRPSYWNSGNQMVLGLPV